MCRTLVEFRTSLQWAVKKLISSLFNTPFSYRWKDAKYGLCKLIFFMFLCWLSDYIGIFSNLIDSEKEIGILLKRFRIVRTANSLNR